MRISPNIYFLLLLASRIFAQHSLVNGSSDVRSFGMGGCGSSLQNPSNYLNNTAHLGLQSTSGIYADIRSYYFVEDLNLAQIQGILKSSANDAFGIEFLRDGSKEFNEIVLGAAYARKILDQSSVGIGFQYFQQNTPESGVHRAMFPSIGLQIKIIPQLVFATQMNNPLPIITKGFHKLPSQFKFAFNYTIYSALHFYTEIQLTNTERTHLRFGIEYKPHDLITIRTGFVSNGNFACGFSCELIKAIDFHMGYELHPVLKSSASAGFTFRFQKIKRDGIVSEN